MNPLYVVLGLGALAVFLFANRSNGGPTGPMGPVGPVLVPSNALVTVNGVKHWADSEIPKLQQTLALLSVAPNKAGVERVWDVVAAGTPGAVNALQLAKQIQARVQVPGGPPVANVITTTTNLYDASDPERMMAEAMPTEIATLAEYVAILPKV